MEENNQKRRNFILTLAQMASAMGASVFAPQLAAKSKSAVVKSVSVSNGRNQQRVTIELDKIIEHKLFRLDSPDRVVLDLKRAHTDGTIKLDPKRSKTLVSRIRYATRNQDDLRIVLDMAQQTKATTKIYKSGRNYRLEVLLSGSGKPVAAPVKKPVEVAKAIPQPPKHANKNFVVAIDPGHGGRDSGAVGKYGTYEKDVVLQISKRLKKRVDKARGMEAFLTRDSDKFLTLRQRIQKARAKHADLFISVHADANENNSVRGSSVYVLSEKGASSEMAYWLAKNENQVDVEMAGATLDSNNKVLSQVLLDLTQSAAIDDSLDLAQGVLSELGTVNRLARKVVESANFGVLRSPDIPSLLIETAFISNPKEEKQLKTARYQNQIANAVYRGIKRYKVALDQREPRYADSITEVNSSTG
ncbi:MAG: N-acetylmuramoyl-L-alanine amidase [Leucothrix sp.]